MFFNVDAKFFIEIGGLLVHAQLRPISVFMLYVYIMVKVFIKSKRNFWDFKNEINNLVTYGKAGQYLTCIGNG